MNQSDLHGAVTFSFGGIFAWQMYVAIDARDLSGPYTVRCCISLLCDVIVTLIDYTLNLFHLFLMIIVTIIIIITTTIIIIYYDYYCYCYYYYYYYYYYYLLLLLLLLLLLFIIIIYYYYHYYYYYCLIITYNVIYLPGIFPICIL